MHYVDSSGAARLHDPKMNRLLRLAGCQCTALSDRFPGSLGACLFLFYSQSYWDYFELEHKSDPRLAREMNDY